MTILKDRSEDGIKAFYEGMRAAIRMIHNYKNRPVFEIMDELQEHERIAIQLGKSARFEIEFETGTVVIVIATSVRHVLKIIKDAYPDDCIIDVREF